MRRAVDEDPPARSAFWSRRCALLGLACALAAVMSSHAGWLRAPAAFALLGGGLGLALVALLLAAAAAVVIWRTGRRGVPAMLSGVALSLLLLGGPAYVAARAYRLPLINDISTDLVDPPRFAATALAARDGLLHEPPSPATRSAQAAAYPDVQPALLDAQPAAAYAAALKLVRARHWRVLSSHPPAAGAIGPGTIDAVARTPIMGFRDDVTIRVAALPPDRSRVDMRSAARFGRGDLGANAARIVSFLSDLEDAVDAE